MAVTLSDLDSWLLAPQEDERLEFKEAKGSFNSEKLAQYCVAIANEGGGYLIFGVSDKLPRRVVGTSVIPDLHRLHERIAHITVRAEELAHPDGRVLVFVIPSRPLGVPLQFEGKYLRRDGESLVPMRPDELQRIFAETTPDYSAEVCTGATLADLEPAAIEEFRRRWITRSGNAALAALSAERLLEDAELVDQGRVTYAALVLFGSRRALGRHLAQAEVVFEYRSSEAPGPAQERVELREGLFSSYDTLWELVNKRNDQQSFQDGLFVLPLPTFNERAVREAILNAVAHRDYRLGGSIFVRQFARRLEVVSPGGFPAGITVENITQRQLPRNRRIAEALSKAGLVERAGQGMDLIWLTCLSESKPRPDFTGTDDFQVALTLNGEIQDERFLRFLERVRRETSFSPSLSDLLVLDSINHGRRVATELRPHLKPLQEHGIIEAAGHGKWILSARLYGFLGQAGTYTRKKGLDHETKKALLLKHITDSGQTGAPMQELGQVLPELSRQQILDLLSELRHEGKAVLTGSRRSSRWHASET